MPRFIIFENVFARFFYFENMFARIQALPRLKAWIWANINFFFFLILVGVYLGRENQRMKYPHTKIVEKKQRLEDRQRISKNEIENLKNKKTHQEIMDEKWPNIYDFPFQNHKNKHKS